MLSNPAARASVDTGLTDLSHERSHVALLERPVEQPAIEIAVIADGRAERDVNVEAGVHSFSGQFPVVSFQFTGSSS